MLARTNSPDCSTIDRPWPAEDLERVDQCPYCGSADRALAHADVQDWSFYAAPGTWNFWTCRTCRSLYLSPRPTPESLARAYGAYYTHDASRGKSLRSAIQDRLRNEYWSHVFDVSLTPRFHLPRPLRGIVSPLRRRILEPFELGVLARRPPGRLMDVGCGHGAMLVMAKDLGWQVAGLELDPAAVRAARSRGLDVTAGSYQALNRFEETFDCVICSHVLEHVYDPADLLRRVAGALKPDGMLLLSTPNATSLVRGRFGNNWRGLEAPRHLSIASYRQLDSSLRAAGFDVVVLRPFARAWTAAESFRIARRGIRLTSADLRAAAAFEATCTFDDGESYDFVELICSKRSHGN